MKIIKRNGSEAAFDITKIIVAVSKANKEIDERQRLTNEQIRTIAANVEGACVAMGRAASVEEIQDLVEKQIMGQGAFDVAKEYICYRYTRSLARRANTTDNQILSLIECNNEEVKQENANKNTTVNSVQRDYMAGEVSKDIARRILLPREIVEAHEQGIIHFHDMDYFAQHMHNCDLVNLEDMLQNGTVITGTLIEKPHSFSTACNIATQIVAQVASNQYGGQSISLAHLAPFVQISREKIRREVEVEIGGHVCKAPEREYGKTLVHVDTKSKVFENVSPETICWMSHNDYAETAPTGFTISAYTDNCPVAAIELPEKNLYGFQFHPEVLHTPEGKTMLHNFVYNVCGCKGDWKMGSFVETSVKALREKIGDGKVLCALSGGVDSSVAAAMLSKAVGKQLTCVFVDHGLLRKNEMEEVCEVFGPNGQFELNFVCVNARQRFYDKLAGVSEPEKKRKIIGEEFIRVFEEEAKKIGTVDFLAQGTIYPDVVESGLGGESTVIKSHHNVGGLPDYVDFKEIVEPLRDLFKDETRQAGRELGLPEYLVSRQPFPGPGLAIRIIGEVTPDKVKMVQEADAIWREEIAKAGLDKSISQYYAALTNMRSVGVMGDERTYDYAVALRAVTTTDFMTAEAAEIPWSLLQTVTSRIVNEVQHVNRVLYDCTGKPPATIEFE